MKDLLENNLKISRLYIDSLDAIIEFNILCFPIDFLEERRLD